MSHCSFQLEASDVHNQHFQIQSCHLVVMFYSIFSRYIDKSLTKSEDEKECILQKYI